MRVAFLCLGIALSASSCTRSGTQSAPLSELAQRGRTVYQVNCTACHNPDPKKSGVLCPDTHGSSKELLLARVIEGKYPPGYTPKRTTTSMAPLPQLKGDIDALTEYLNAP